MWEVRPAETAVTSGSLDQRIAEQALNEGLISAADLEASRRLTDSLRLKGIERDLTEVLVERDLLDQAQLQQLREKLADAKELGGFRILSRLGQGGMGAVFKALQVSLDRVVAIKVLDKRFAAEPEFLARFRREARAAARLDHPNVVQVLDVGEEHGVHFIAMELIDGESALDRIKRLGPLREADALGIVVKVLAALDYAHKKGIVHRDVKPDNILLSHEGSVKLADLGLAKDLTTPRDGELTTTGAVMGTPNYISPEQALGRTADIRSDLYSLGVSLFHLVTGRPPFEGSSPVLVMTAHIQEPAPDPRELQPELSETCAGLIRWLLQKDAAQRPQTPREVLVRLDAINDATTVVSREWGGRPPVSIDNADTVIDPRFAAELVLEEESGPAPAPKRRRWRLLLAAMLALLVLAFVVQRIRRKLGQAAADSLDVDSQAEQPFAERLAGLPDDGLPPWLGVQPIDSNDPVSEHIEQLRGRWAGRPMGPDMSLRIALRVSLETRSDGVPLWFCLRSGRRSDGPQEDFERFREALLAQRLDELAAELTELQPRLLPAGPRPAREQLGLVDLQSKFDALQRDLAARRDFQARDQAAAFSGFAALEGDYGAWCRQRLEPLQGLRTELEELGAAYEGVWALSWSYRPMLFFDFTQPQVHKQWHAQPKPERDGRGLILAGSRERQARMTLKLPVVEQPLYGDFQLLFRVKLLEPSTRVDGSDKQLEKASLTVALGPLEVRAEAERVVVKHTGKTGQGYLFEHPGRFGPDGASTIAISWGPDTVRLGAERFADEVQLAAEPIRSISFKARCRLQIEWVAVVPRGLWTEP